MRERRRRFGLGVTGASASRLLHRRGIVIVVEVLDDLRDGLGNVLQPMPLEHAAL
jgi:UDP-N-acetylmuramoylalanine-D-glutamate ligase